MTRKLVIGALIVAAAWVLLVSYIQPSRAHSWYPPSCCSGTATGGDCMPVPEGGVAEMSSGFRIKTSDPIWGAVDETVALKDTQPSHDGRYHMCLKDAGYPIRIRCFFAPLGY